MKVCSPWMKVTSILAVLVFVAMQLPVKAARASMIRTEQVLEGPQDIQAKRAKVRRFLGREDVRAQMIELGVDPDEAIARAESLSDAEVAQLAGRLDELPAGQGALETVLIIGVVVFFVLLVTDLVGLTRVYPFVRRPAPQGQ